jgi:hypothetical protein
VAAEEDRQVEEEDTLVEEAHQEDIPVEGVWEEVAWT